MYPLNDENMTYDKVMHRFVLTDKGAKEAGFDIENMIRDASTRKAFLNRVSLLTYNYIHKFNSENKVQDYFIAKCDSLRTVIYEAMQEQAVYMAMNGDMTLSTDEKKRQFWFSQTAKEILYRDIPEIGTSILYAGRFRLNSNDIDYIKDEF